MREQAFYFLRILLLSGVLLSLSVQAGKQGREEDEEDVAKVQQLTSPLKRPAVVMGPLAPVVRISPPEKGKTEKKSLFLQMLNRPPLALPAPKNPHTAFLTDP